jgi:hypothetical protein
MLLDAIEEPLFSSSTDDVPSGATLFGVILRCIDLHVEHPLLKLPISYLVV